MIEGVKIRPLTKHVDDRGYLMEILRDDDAEFTRFGQVYVSTCLPGIVKAWHAHTLQTDHLCIVKGLAKIGLYDGREDSPTFRQTQAIITGELNSMLIQIPPLIWHGYMGLGTEPVYIMNVPTVHYNRQQPDELRVDPFDNDFGFEWQPKSR
jgi:dTDP-4-dehydrorhamnose 3,5-epimerase